ncbi:MAG: bifunctional pyr operon transcriptional regulator/uracil phosphoribosyltransferase PyrR [Chitinispirillia bacterium]|nr:bifunctional pyr operon transcriptional regulator/uracil phosphoribosyltransferase PyrR [Chitinispirillia bacterium]MCL2269642.1 bifunctional pyr operon transcriptional regulator/uracil phosphoribosyltransferase PyrR [Chitinispirillia bacterium]
MKKIELIMDAHALDLALTRITHQILERHGDLSSVCIVGMQTRGVYLAGRIAAKINAMESVALNTGILDTTLYRDDYRSAFRQPEVRVTDIPFDINEKNVVLVDDVLFTGRTVRAALDALMDHGRPRTIQLAALVDRGHRELPIRGDYVGKKITTSPTQEVALKIVELDGEDSLWLTEVEDK